MTLLLVDDRDGRIVSEVQTEDQAQLVLERESDDSAVNTNLERLAEQEERRVRLQPRLRRQRRLRR